MIRQWNKNDDLVVSLYFNADSITYFRAEYYTDSAYKFVVENFLVEDDGKKFIFIPASELQLMNDGLLKSDIFYGYESEHFEDGSLDVRSHSNLDIYIYNDSPAVDPSITKLSLLENDMHFVTEDDLNEFEVETDEKYNALSQKVEDIELQKLPLLAQEIESLKTKSEGLDSKNEEVDLKLAQLKNNFDYLNDNKADKEEIPTKTSQLYNDSGFITEHQSLDNYATKAELATKANIDSVPSLDGYATESWVLNQKYLKEHQNLDHLATKAELNTKANITDIPSVAGFATESWVERLNYLKEHQNLDHLASKSEVNTKVAELNDYIQITNTNLTNLIKSVENSSNDQYDEVKEEIQDIKDDVQQKAYRSELSTKLSQLENDTNFATKEYVDAHSGGGGSSEVTKAYVDLGDLTVKKYVDDKIGDIDTLLNNLIYG